MAQADPPVPAFPTPCNDPFLQAPATQQYIFNQFLCAVLNFINSSDLDCSDLDAAQLTTEAVHCIGDPNKLRLVMTQLICANQPTIDCSQPVCWSPEDLQAQQLYLVYLLLTAIQNRT